MTQLRRHIPGLQMREACRPPSNGVTEHVDLMVDEFKRILALVGKDSEIGQLCQRAIKGTYQNFPVIVQRDRAENDLVRERVMLDWLQLQAPDSDIWAEIADACNIRSTIRRAMEDDGK